jgi:IclR family mhp operon transcriptional activator
MAAETLRGLDRGLQVLDALDAANGLSLRQLHRITGLPKPTLLRILATLENHGYARRRLADGSWCRSARRGANPNAALLESLLDVGGDALDELCRRIVWPSDLAVYDRGAMTVLETTRRKTPFVVHMTGIGYRVPMLQTGLGRAWIAFCSDEEREGILAELAASESPFDRAARDSVFINAIVTETREQGYGTRAAGFTLRGAAERTDGVAVPVMMRGRIIACISLVWLVSALDRATAIARYLPDVKAAAAKIGDAVYGRLIPHSPAEFGGRMQ